MTDELPRTVKSIELTEMWRLKIDSATNELYFDDKKVQFTQVITLDKWQLRWAIFFGAIGLIFGGVNCWYNWSEIQKNLKETPVITTLTPQQNIQLKIVLQVPKGAKLAPQVPLTCTPPLEISSDYYNTTCSGLILNPTTIN